MFATLAADLRFPGSAPHDAAWTGKPNWWEHVKTISIARCSLGLVAAATLALTACGNTPDTAPGSAVNAGVASAAAPSEDAVATLTRAQQAMGESTFRIVMKLGELGRVEGPMDPAKQRSELTMTVTTEGMEIVSVTRAIGTDRYTRTKATGGEMADMPDMPGMDGMDGKTWYHFNASQRPDNAMTLSTFDGAQIASTLQHATDVQKVGDKAFKGTLDLAKAGDALGVGESDVKKLPSTRIPFQVTLDDQGRVAQYDYELPAMAGEPAQPVTLEFRDYGTPVEVEAPPAKEVKKKPGN